MNYEKLLHIQSELKAPKLQFNSFAKFNYRSCEDILEAVKPLLVKVKAVLILSDDVVEVGGRNYIKAAAGLFDAETGEQIAVTNAFAREAIAKSGMDDSQITGTASSYARKYALNALFAIDDTKDADTDETTAQTRTGASKKKEGVTLRDALRMEVDIKDKTYKLGDMNIEQIEWVVKHAADELKEAAELVLKEKFKQEIKQGDLPFGDNA